jgi:hypothetical protein
MRMTCLKKCTGLMQLFCRPVLSLPDRKVAIMIVAASEYDLVTRSAGLVGSNRPRIKPSFFVSIYPDPLLHLTKGLVIATG